MSLECNKCSKLDSKCHDLPRSMIDVVIRVGKSQEYLHRILKYDLFAYSRDLKEPERTRVQCINDDLWHLYNILRGSDEH